MFVSDMSFICHFGRGRGGAKGRARVGDGTSAFAGAKAHQFLWASSARLKSCPVTKPAHMEFVSELGILNAGSLVSVGIPV
jgi:hypothetical protein